MTEGQKTAFCKAVCGRVSEPSKHPLLALEDLGVSVDDFVCSLAEDEQFCRDALFAMCIHARKSKGQVTG
jgi:hypothetical protein